MLRLGWVDVRISFHFVQLQCQTEISGSYNIKSISKRYYS